MKHFKLYCPQCKKIVSDDELVFTDGIAAVHYHDGEFHDCIKISNTCSKDREGKQIYQYDVLRVPSKIRTRFSDAYVPVKYVVIVQDDAQQEWIAEQVDYKPDFPYEVTLSDVADKSRIQRSLYTN